MKPFAVGLVGFEKCLPFVPIHIFPLERARFWHSSKLCPFFACSAIAFSTITGLKQITSADTIMTIRNIGSSIQERKGMKANDRSRLRGH
jgi:hypothetical protein